MIIIIIIIMIIIMIIIIIIIIIVKLIIIVIMIVIIIITMIIIINEMLIMIMITIMMTMLKLSIIMMIIMMIIVLIIMPIPPQMQKLRLLRWFRYQSPLASQSQSTPLCPVGARYAGPSSSISSLRPLKHVLQRQVCACSGSDKWKMISIYRATSANQQGLVHG